MAENPSSRSQREHPKDAETRQLYAAGRSAALSGPGEVSLSGPPDADKPAPPARPLALQGRRIPSRNATARRHVIALYREATWLTGADLPAVVRWAVLTVKFGRLAEALDRLPDGGVVKADGDPRKGLGELRALSGEITRLESALGVTASARAALGVSIQRMSDLATLMAGAGETAHQRGQDAHQRPPEGEGTHGR